MKSTAAAAVAILLLTAQVDALAIRPAAIRPGSVLARPSIPSPAITAARPCVVIDESELEQAVEEVAVEQPRPKPAVIDQGQIIRPTAIQGGQVLLPAGRPLKPSDLIRPVDKETAYDVGSLIRPSPINVGSLTRPAPVNVGSLIRPAPVDVGSLTRPAPVEEVPFGGHGSSISTKPSRPVVVFPWMKPATGDQQNTQQRPAVLPVRQEEDDQQVQIVLLPSDRPLRPSDLIPGSQLEQKPAVRPIPINQQVGGNGPDQFLPVRPIRPVVVAEEEQADEPQYVLLPNDRPLRPSDLIPGLQQQEEEKPALRPIPINQQVGGNGPDQFIPIRPRPVVVAEEKPAVRPIPINQQVGGNGPDQFLPIRPIRPAVVAEEEQAEEPEYVLLPNDRPLRPSDLIPGFQQQEEKPAVRPIPINQQVGGNGPDQFIPIRPRPVVVTEDKPAVRPIPINQQVGGNGPDQFLPIRPIRPAVVTEEEQADEPQYVLLPNDRPLRPSDLIPGFQQQEEKPAVRPIPINQQVGGNGPDQFIPIRPRPVVVAEEKPAVRPIPINQQVGGNGPDQFLPIRPIRPAVVAEEEQAEEPEYVLLPNDRPLRPSDLIPGFQQQEEKPAVRPIPINQQVGGNGPDQFIPIRPRPVVVQEEEVEEQGQQIVLLPNDRPLRPSDLIPAEQLLPQEPRPIFIRPAGQQQQNNWSKYPEGYLPVRPLRPVNDIIF